MHDTGPDFEERKRIAWERFIKPMKLMYSRPTRFTDDEQVTEYLKQATESVVRALPTGEPKAVIDEVCEQAYKALVDGYGQHGWPLPATLREYVDDARKRVCPVRTEHSDHSAYRPVANPPDTSAAKKDWTLEQARSAIKRCDAELGDPEISDFHAQIVATLRRCAVSAFWKALQREDPEAYQRALASKEEAA